MLAFEADDPNQMEALFQDADIRIIPLERGAFRAKMKTAAIGTLQLHHVSVTSKILTEGTTADCSTSLIFPSNSGGPVTFQGMTLAADEIMLHGPRAEHCAVGAASEISVIVLPTNLLEMELSACMVLTPETRQKVRKGNYERVFDTARVKVRAWEVNHVSAH